MNRPRQSALQFALLALSMSCASATAPVTVDGSVTVDKAQYSMAAADIFHRFSIVYTFVNRSSTTLYLQRDCSNYIDYQLARPGVDILPSAYNTRFCSLTTVRKAPIAVPAGSTRVDSLDILGVGDRNEPLSSYTGTFELRLRVTLAADGSNVVPMTVRRSGSFTVVAM